MSKRTDKAKIDFIKFINCFMGLLDEVKDRRNRATFDLLEFNGDAQLDIMYLMQLFNNVSRKTMFGQEILKLTREYKAKNVLGRKG